MAAGAIGTGRELLYNLWYLLTALLVCLLSCGPGPASAGCRWSGMPGPARSQVGKMAEERLVVQQPGYRSQALAGGTRPLDPAPPPRQPGDQPPRRAKDA